MITIEKEWIETIPVLHVVKHDKRNEKLPVVVYYHGFTSEKDSSLTLAYKLAERGIRTILPDSLFHGDRKNNISQEQLTLSFWDIVIQNIKELPEIISYLKNAQLIREGKIGVGGTSMGAITTYGALRQYDWINVACALMGTPNMIGFAELLIDHLNESEPGTVNERERKEVLEKIAPFDLSKSLQMLNNRPLFIWHGDEDPVVPFEHDEQFYERAKHTYKNDEHVLFLREKNRGHHVSSWSIREAAAWFDQFLQAKQS